ALAVAGDGSVYVGGVIPSVEGKGLLLHLSSTGSEMSRIDLKGIPTALAIDGSGAIYLTGYLPARITEASLVQEAFAAKFPPDLKTTTYNVGLGSGAVAIGTALATGGDGSLYVAIEGTLPGMPAVAPFYT